MKWKKKRLKKDKRKKSKKQSKDNASSSEDKVISPSSKKLNSYCSLCQSSDHLTDTLAWIGCGGCPRWYHTWCAGAEFEDMSEGELEDAEFECVHCLMAETQ